MSSDGPSSQADTSGGPSLSAAATSASQRGPAAPPASAAGAVWAFLLGVLLILAGIGAFAGLGMPSAPPAKRPPSIPPRVEASSADFELVGVLEGEQILLYLTRYIGNEPIHGAQLILMFDDREVPVAERGGGVYVGAVGTRPLAPQIAVTLQIAHDGKDDLLGGMLDIPSAAAVAAGSGLFGSVLHPGPWLLALGAFLGGFGRARRRGRAAASVAALGAFGILATALPADAHPGHGEGEAGVSREELESSVLPPNSPRRLSDGSLFVPKQAQFILGIRTALTHVGEATRSTRLVGRVVGDPAASGTVQSSLVGRIELTADGLPRVGQPVSRGQVLATITPVINPLDRGNIQQQISLIDRELGILQRRAEDATSANGNGASGDAGLDRVPAGLVAAEIEALSRRRATMNRVLLDREALRIPLRAPTDGVVAVANVVAGQIVEARDTLYEIVDPKRIWVEAAAYDPAILNGIAGGSAVASDGRVFPLSYIGHGPKLNQQAIPLLFHVREPVMLPIGTPVSVLVETRERHSGIILPPAAVVRNPAGQSVVWQHAAAERFVPLIVRVEPIDGRSVAVVDGLPDDRRVVVVGADLLNQIR